MAIQSLPGATGFTYARVASMDKRAVGKLTDANHLESFHSTEPADYDKKIISLYTQSSLYSNDFLDMINKSTPYYIDNNSDYRSLIPVIFTPNEKNGILNSKNKNNSN